MKRYFGDTSYFIALMMKPDVAHMKARKVTAQLRGLIITSEWIFAEVGNYLSASSHRAAFCRYVDQLRSDRSIEILPATSEDFQAGMLLYRNRLDKNWSLVDCVSIAQATSHKVRDVLTTDQHFVQAGFNALLIE